MALRLTPAQRRMLDQLVVEGRVQCDVDRQQRTGRALVRRGLARYSEGGLGWFVIELVA